MNDNNNTETRFANLVLSQRLADERSYSLRATVAAMTTERDAEMKAAVAADDNAWVERWLEVGRRGKAAVDKAIAEERSKAIGRAAAAMDRFADAMGWDD